MHLLKPTFSYVYSFVYCHEVVGEQQELCSIALVAHQ